MGMLGGEIVDERSWIVKTHYPLPIPFSLEYSSNKVIMIVRNPLDGFPSMFNLNTLGSHSATHPFENLEEAPALWDEFVRMLTRKHKDYYDIVLNRDMKNESCPIYFLRFEDLLKNKRDELEGVFKFILDLDDLEGTNVQRRINAIT
jgi:hypothetical protein